ncbi:hypothetical protein SAMN05444483_10637 [Salegentibacter echinorum]|uniref:Uncharacterized protein n=1 Tax=Salegentibacter echinorum TaxID=1073325 RepID=A0A1M5HWZ4_SALEC|nr:hypothetical protein [Salegentibacter echinorum]SHG20447.1 hypothetical protein SAMN05444483_10637 [Salegentibacter echinorum]
MKTLQQKLMFMLLVIAPIFMNAQNQAYWVHEDQVKPAKVMEYEQVTKDFIDACKEHNLQNGDWAAAQVNDGKYLTISPIQKMADFDKNPLAPLAEKMGEEEFRRIFDRFNQCYDKHRDYIVILNSDLSYMPEGLDVNTPGQDYRKWHFLHVVPSNISKLRAKMKEIKALYSEKDSKEYYRVYRSAFGTNGDYYLVTISAKDALSYAQVSAENDKFLGEEGEKMMRELYGLLESYEVKTGRMRPDLGYAAVIE